MTFLRPFSTRMIAFTRIASLGMIKTAKTTKCFTRKFHRMRSILDLGQAGLKLLFYSLIWSKVSFQYLVNFSNMYTQTKMQYQGLRLCRQKMTHVDACQFQLGEALPVGSLHLCTNDLPVTNYDSLWWLYSSPFSVNSLQRYCEPCGDTSCPSKSNWIAHLRLISPDWPWPVAIGCT